MGARWIALATLPFVWGCDALKADTTTLWSTTTEPVERPRCDACHGFAPRTGAHRFHMDTSKMVAGMQTITCMDCHAASIASSRTTVLDTMFFDMDPAVLPKHTKGYPWWDFPRPDTIDPNMVEIKAIDSFPLAFAAPEPGAENPFWITAAAKAPGLPGHANGTLDVVFAERHANFTADDGSVHRASWNPVRLSCNAVACHGSEALDSMKYVWKEPQE